MRLYTLAALAAVTATTATAETRVAERDLTSLLVRCEKPVASISVGAFSCKATACQEAAAGSGNGMAALLQLAQASQGLSVQTFPTLGSSMGSGLTTTLKATGCFTVQEREALEELKREAALAGVEIKPTAADYLVSGAITAVVLNTRSNSFGGGLLPVVDLEKHPECQPSDRRPPDRCPRRQCS